MVRDCHGDVDNDGDDDDGGDDDKRARQRG